MYKCAIPYSHVVIEEDWRRSNDDDEAAGHLDIWISGFPSECDKKPELLLDLVRATVPNMETVRVDIQVASCGGNATLTVRPVVVIEQVNKKDAAAHLQVGAKQWANTCVRKLNGVRYPSKSVNKNGRGGSVRKLVVVHANIAKVKMSVHKRVKRVLKRLSVGLMRSNKHKNPARSFHNFTSSKKVAKSAATAMRKSLMRCSSGFQDDISAKGCGGGSGGSGGSGGGGSGGNSDDDESWVDTEWFVVSFSAVSFLPEQVQRMAGVLVSVMRGKVNMDDVDAMFFDEKLVKTPFVPASAIWLDSSVHQIETMALQSEMLRSCGERVRSMREMIRQAVVGMERNAVEFQKMIDDL